MIIGIGVDTVDIGRFTASLSRTPKLRDRLFTPGERNLPFHSLAARFAAKEALIKALGGSDGITWQGMEIVGSNREAPLFTETAELLAVLLSKRARLPHVSMTHDGGMATAFVILESDGTPR